MPIINVTPPAEEPITLADAKIQCQIDADIVDEDSVIDSYISAATGFCENYTGRPLITQEKQYLGTFCPPPPRSRQYHHRLPVIELTPNLLSVESVVYIDADGDTQTLDPEAYYVDTASVVGRVIPLEAWPSVKHPHPQPVTINFTCGYGEASDVPSSIKQCMRLLVGHWYRNREATITGVSSAPLDFAVDALLNQHRVFRIG